MGTFKEVRGVLDTNVVISALLFGGTPGRLIPLWKSGRIKPFASGQIIKEWLRVLAYPRFKLTEMEVEYLLYCEILPYFELTTTQKGPTIIKADPSDDKFIRCAEASRASYIVSGDRHLLRLKKHGTIEILSPSEFLKTFK